MVVLREELQSTQAHEKAFVKAQVPTQGLDVVSHASTSFTTLHLHKRPMCYIY
jgi:hypothetical protein